MLKKLIIVTSILISSFNIFVFSQNITEIGNGDQENTSEKSNNNTNSFSNNLSFGDEAPVSDINVPKLESGGFEGDEPIILAKDLVYKVIEALPFIIFVMLLLGCFHMIVSVKDGEGKKGARIIKQVILGTILFIISIYVLNIVSIYLTGAPVISTNRIFHSYMGGTNYGL